ncbi:TrmB family transcriptional regulator sugar-binding domain-containing protein, partial [Marivivens sp.]|uniref:TrmB family transcriptional regulator n=1 Tax=Marivivens sp. TaxID=1978374 RepID=UPI0025C562E1
CAKSPATGIENTKQKMESDFIQNQNVILNELVPLYEKSGTSERPDIWVLSGAVNITAKILEMVDSCRDEVMITLPEVGVELVKQALPKLRALHDKGVKITILTSDKIDKESITAIKRVADVKIKKGLFGGGIISDKRYVVILSKTRSSPLGATLTSWAATGAAKSARAKASTRISSSFRCRQNQRRTSTKGSSG